MMTKKVGLVIGGNRGIGYALVQALAQHWGNRGLVYLTARRETDAEEAQRALEAVTGLAVARLRFDLSDPEDPVRTSRELAERHGGLDIVVQNGAYLPRAGRPARDDARPMTEANSHGTLRVLRAFLPAMREGGQMVIVASGMGTLRNLPEHLHPLFDTRTKGPDAINEAIDGYVAAVEDGTAAAQGWPEWVNLPSKIGQVAVTRSFARSVRPDVPAGLRINAACPGVTLTDATKDYMGTVFKEEDAQTPDQAAAGLMKLLTMAPDVPQPYGELVRHGQVIPFGDDQP